MGKIIEIAGLRYAYDPAAPRSVLSDVDLEVERGELTLLVGPSGCGKTTLLLCLNGIIPHQLAGGKLEGSVRVAGRDTHTSRVAERASAVGLVFQNPDEQLTCLFVEDEVAFGPENLCLPKEETWARVEEALRAVGLAEFRQKVVHSLSGGQKQRLCIGACLAMRPDLLLLDGPISNTDPRGSEEILEMVSTVCRQEGLTTVIAEYDIDRILPLADKVAVMDDRGRLIEHAPARRVVELGPRLTDEMGLWIPQVAEAGLALRRRGVAVSALPLTEAEALETFRGLEQSSHLLATARTRPVETASAARRPAGTAPAVVQAERLSHTYPDGTQALADVSLEIRAGEFVALVGQNGSGKTTFAMHLVGILRPTRGRLLVNGKDTRRTHSNEITRDVAYVFQYPEHQFIRSTVFDELAFGLRLDGQLSEADVERRVEETLVEIGLADQRSRHPYALSVGEKRRLSVAVMTITGPKAIILDEPTYGQDRSFTYQLMSYVMDLNRRGTTVLFITHNMKLVAEFASRAVVFHRGRLVFDGAPRDLFVQSELVHQVHLAPPPIASVSMHMWGQHDFALSVDEFCDRLLARATAPPIGT